VPCNFRPANFELPLCSPVTERLLYWDPAFSPDAPSTHLCDPNFPHRVLGNPTGNNFFRVEGPPGSFAADSNACVDPVGGLAVVVDGSCLESADFFIMGKKAVKACVQSLRATFCRPGPDTSGYLEVFATSRPLQTLMVSGPGMEGGVDNNLYYAKIRVPGPSLELSATAPDQTTLTKTNDGSIWVEDVVDGVVITKAEYNVDIHTLTVHASSTDTLGVQQLEASFSGVNPE
jgi:hypothetical protein